LGRRLLTESDPPSVIFVRSKGREKPQLLRKPLGEGPVEPLGRLPAPIVGLQRRERTGDLVFARYGPGGAELVVAKAAAPFEPAKVLLQASIILAPSLSSDGSKVAVAAGTLGDSLADVKLEARVFDVGNGRELGRFAANSVALAPDGTSLAAAVGAGDRQQLELRGLTGAPLRTLLKGEVGALAFHPDGRRLLVTRPGAEPGQRDVFVLDLADGRIQRLTDGAHITGQLHWSRDGWIYVSVGDSDRSPDLWRLMPR
jgi:hypothetical protein